MNTSIFLSPDWLMTRYAGWRLVHQDADSLVLVKGCFPVRRVCILSVLPLTKFIAQRKFAKYVESMSILTVKIIPPDDASVPTTQTLGLIPTPDAQRMFHKFTFIIDLTSTVEQLWMAMRSTNRNLCKKAEQTGIRVRLTTEPKLADVDYFFHLYGAMARSRGLAIPKRAMLLNMFSDGRLILACAERNGTVLSMALVYLAGDAAMYLYGVSPGRSASGAGQLLQWHVMQALKARGTIQYDLGGVPSIDESDGIFKFKKGFGGLGTALGPEFSKTPVWFQTIRRVRSWL